MNKQPLASASGWVGMFGVVLMLAMGACESVAVDPAPGEAKPAVRTTTSNEDPPEKPTKPPGGS
ncbi:hypothetical protein GGR92_002362 [Spirosoma lacussanchae]|uniref:hypothetical protein n=1 Tax=Spirosoma lacussanchae TaxID=1884249 RepID=UPI001109BAE9|nr:hypothetical protein [Spirosoma lacussanchae]